MRPAASHRLRYAQGMSCYLDEFVSYVVTMLERGAAQDEVDRFLQTIIPEYRADVLAAAREIVQERQPDT